MTKKTRRAIFFILLAVFLIASPAIILYSLGYELNIKTLKIEKTGGIFVDVDYSKYKITIDDNIVRDVSKTPLLSNGIFIPNLIPKTYKVVISKEGYLNWEKNIEVKSAIVSEIKNVILVKKDISFDYSQEKVSNFLISPSHEKIAYVSNDSLFLISSDKKTILENLVLPTKDLKMLAFSENDSDVFLENEKSIFKTSFSDETIVEIKKPRAYNYLKILPSQDDPDILYALSNSSFIDELNFQNKTIKKMIPEASNFYISGKNLIYASKDPINFYRVTISSGNETQMTFNPLKDLSYNDKIIEKFGDPIAILKSNGDLAIFDYKIEAFDKFDSNVKDVILSGDTSKLLYRKDHEVYAYYLEPSYPGKKAGELSLLGRYGESIDDAKWFLDGNHHVLIQFKNNIKLLEIDGRDKRNTYDIAKDATKFLFDNFTKELVYLDTENNLKTIKMEE